MPSTAHALVVLLIAVLPGALYTWAFEREVGRWGIGLSDRLLRFVGASAVFHLAYALPLWAYRPNFLQHRLALAPSEQVREQLLAAQNGKIVAAAALYVFVPLVVGSAVARAVRSDSGWPRALGRVLVGRDPAPRAWDALFSPRPAALVRGRLKETHAWFGGLFGERSYAAGYPEEPQDLLLEQTFRVQDDGEFERSDDDRLIPIGSALLIRWSELEFLEVFEVEERE